MSGKDKPMSSRPRGDPWQVCRRFTAARIGLGRAGSSLPTAPLLDFQLAHARARDAVQRDLDVDALAAALGQSGLGVVRLASAANERRTFIQRPDLGRILSDHSKELLAQAVRHGQMYDVAFVIADGLSAVAVERHAPPLIERVVPRLLDAGWRIAPLCLVRQGRVAIADEIGALWPAAMSVMLIGERPGLSSPDSLGLYLTWDPLPGRSNAERNCIANVRPEGLDYRLAAHKLLHLMAEARRRRLSGVDLKEDAPALAPPDSPGLPAQTG